MGHTLDLVIDCVENYVVRCENVESQDTIPGHMVENFIIFRDEIPKNKSVINFRNHKSLNVVDFSNHLLTNFEQLHFRTVLI